MRTHRPKIYIAGPDSDVPGYKARFLEAKLELEKWGYAVLNQAELPEGLPWEDNTKIRMAMLAVADMIYMAPGWDKSSIAGVERMIAERCGKEILYGED